jgi:aspartate aminotransferase
MRLSPNIKELTPSPTLALSQRVHTLRAQGHTILDMSLGEPDFPMPQLLKNTAKQAIDEGWTRYTPVAGLPMLREQLAQTLSQQKGVGYHPSEIMLSTGAKQCIAQAIYCLVAPGDEVLLLAPFWPSYETQIRLAGGIPRIFHTHAKDHYEPDIQALKKHINSRTKMIILNSPNNPTGAVYSAETLQRLSEIVLAHDLWLLSDEIYEHLVYEGQQALSPLQVCPDIKNKTILINGFSKAFAMAGWRLGYMAAPVDVIEACSALQGALTSGANNIAQRTALAALSLPQGFFDELCVVFSRRLALLRNALLAIPDLQVPSPRGAFYILPDFKSYLGSLTPQGERLQSSFDLATYLLDAAQVATVPGAPFYAPNCLRLAYATDEAIIQQAVKQIAHALQQLDRKAKSK